MTVDISRVFKANVKAIRVSLNNNDSTNEAAILNEELLGNFKNLKVNFLYTNLISSYEIKFITFHFL